MIVTSFRDPLKGAQLHWMTPVLALGLGGALGLAGAAALNADGVTPASLTAALMGAAASLAGLAALGFRIRARFAADRAGEDRANQHVDLAVIVVFVVYGLGLLAIGVGGLRHNLAPQQAYAGALVEAQLGHGRGYHEIRLRMAGAAQPLEWTCWMACGPYHALQARKADAPKMRVLALDERIIGLEIDGRVLLSPGQGRWRWFGRDAFLTSVGLFLVWGLCLRLFRMAKDGPGGVYSTTAW